ncbi:ATP-binding protein [Chloroflexota bacterium]
MSGTSSYYQELIKTRSKTSEKVKEVVKREIDPIYKELAGRIEEGLEDDKYMPHILEKLMTLEQARIARELPDQYRAPETGRLEVSEEFAKKLGMDKKMVDKYIQELYDKGVLFPTRSGPQMPRTPNQFKDAATNNPKVHGPLGREYLELFDAFDMQEERNNARAERFYNQGGGWRVLPRWRAIKDIPGILPLEDIRELLKKEKETISLTNCPCRSYSVSRTCDIPIESCINFGGGAQYNISRGSAKKVTLKEAMDAITQLDKYPVVHLTPNAPGGESRLICNCHWDCCGSLRVAFVQDKYKIDEVLVKSRFEAIVDPEKCIACKTCLEMCQFDAIRMNYYPEHGEERSHIDSQKCMGCGCCVVNCPIGAITMKTVRPPEYLPAPD